MLEKTLERPFDCKEIKPFYPKGSQSWIFIGKTDAEAETPILWLPDAKNWLTGKDWCWDRLNAGGEGDDKGWAGWMSSPTRWTWVESRSWWWTENPGVLQSMGLQSRTRLSNWTELNVSENTVKSYGFFTACLFRPNQYEAARLITFILLSTVHS